LIEVLKQSIFDPSALPNSKRYFEVIFLQLELVQAIFKKLKLNNKGNSALNSVFVKDKKLLGMLQQLLLVNPLETVIY